MVDQFDWQKLTRLGKEKLKQNLFKALSFSQRISDLIIFFVNILVLDFTAERLTGFGLVVTFQHLPKFR
jgi:hypothetical protein